MVENFRELEMEALRLIDMIDSAVIMEDIFIELDKIAFDGDGNAISKIVRIQSHGLRRGYSKEVLTEGRKRTFKGKVLRGYYHEMWGAKNKKL